MIEDNRLRKNQKGSTTMEAAILMPMVFMILCSSIYFCIYLYDITTIRSVVRNEISQEEWKADQIQRKIQKQTIKKRKIQIKYSEKQECLEVKGEGYSSRYDAKKSNMQGYIRKVKIIADGIEGK